MDKWMEKAKSMRPGFLHIFDKDTIVGLRVGGRGVAEEDEGRNGQFERHGGWFCAPDVPLKLS